MKTQKVETLPEDLKAMAEKLIADKFPEEPQVVQSDIRWNPIYDVGVSTARYGDPTTVTRAYHEVRAEFTGEITRRRENIVFPMREGEDIRYQVEKMRRELEVRYIEPFRYEVTRY